MPTIALPTKDRTLEPYTTGEPIVLAAEGHDAEASIASPMRRRMWWPIRSPTSIRGSTPRSTGTRPSRFGTISGTSASASPRRWTPRSAAWGSTGPSARELIRRALDAAKTRPGVKICCGAGTDHLDAPRRNPGIDDIIRAYEEQIEAIEAMGGRLVIMASRALARAAKAPADYARVYGRILRQVKEPVIIHWLGEMFDPGARRLLGLGRSYGGDGDLPRHHRRPCRQDRRRQDFAAVEGEGNRDAPPAARRACACIPATISTMPN